MRLAFLEEASPFFDLFPRGAVPIKNVLLPSRVELEGSEEREAYMLDVEALSPEQFHGTIQREMMLRGMPIRKSQVRSVATDELWFL